MRGFQASGLLRLHFGTACTMLSGVVPSAIFACIYGMRCILRSEHGKFQHPGTLITKVLRCGLQFRGAPAR